MSAVAGRPDGDGPAGLAGLTARERLLSLACPERTARVLAALAVLGLAASAAGGWLLARHRTGAGVAALAVGVNLVLVPLAMLPAVLWSRRHREQARRAAQLQRHAADRRLRGHPVLHIVVLPVVLGVVTPLRLGVDRYSPATLLVVGAATAAVTAAVMVPLVHRARRRPSEG